MRRIPLLRVVVVASVLGGSPSLAAASPAESGDDGVVLDCTGEASAIAGIRERLAVGHGSEVAARTCVAFFDAGEPRAYARLAVVSLSLPGQTRLELYGLRPDGGWTDLTPGPFLYDPALDRLDVVPGRTSGMPTVHVSRGETRVVFIFDPDRGLYWVVPAG